MFPLFCFTVPKNNANRSNLPLTCGCETPKIFFQFYFKIQLKTVRKEISVAFYFNWLCFVNSGLESLFSKETNFLVKNHLAIQ